MGSILVATTGRFWFAVALSAACLATIGCGTTRDHQATQQLVLSKAVDQSIAGIDFRPLSGQKVFLDTSYLKASKTIGFVNADYVVSSLRQQIVAAGCLLQDAAPDSDVIIEARIGTLGADDHRVTFGIPENNTFSSAASLIPNSPRLPSLPEISLARREAREGAAKIAVFAYDRETREAVWQSGIRESSATARDTYVFGVGPFQSGTIRKQTKLAGSRLFRFGDDATEPEPDSDHYVRPHVDYTGEARFHAGWPVAESERAFIDYIEGPHGAPSEEKEVVAEQSADEAASEVR
ncbi:MAG: DUF6655 family protein [Novipirellula sp. JB048]